MLAKNDRWGQSFHSRLLGTVLEFATAREIASAQNVCQTWKLPEHVENRLFQTRYTQDFEPETIDRAVIVQNGTSFKKRYHKRLEIDRNWRQGNFTMRRLGIVNYSHVHALGNGFVTCYGLGFTSIFNLAHGCQVGHFEGFVSATDGWLMVVESNKNNLRVCKWEPLNGLQEVWKVPSDAWLNVISRAIVNDSLILLKHKECNVYSISQKSLKWQLKHDSGTPFHWVTAGQKCFYLDNDDTLTQYSLEDSTKVHAIDKKQLVGHWNVMIGTDIPKRHVFLTALDKSRVCLLDPQTGQLQRDLQLQQCERIGCNDQFVVCCSSYGDIDLVDLRTGQKINTFYIVGDADSRRQRLVVDPFYIEFPGGVVFDFTFSKASGFGCSLQ